jgi:hypothetical protein
MHPFDVITLSRLSWEERLQEAERAQRFASIGQRVPLSFGWLVSWLRGWWTVNRYSGPVQTIYR